MINEKTLQKLQYRDVLQKVSSFCVSQVAKRKVMSMLPADSFDVAQAALFETRQAYNLFQYETSFDLAVDDVAEICSLARVGYCLSMKQLLQIMRTLRTARNLQTSLFFDYGIDVSLLQTRAYALFVDKDLEDDLDFSILSEDEMNDRASDDLFALRKKIKAINADIKQKLQSYTKNSELSKYLQDSIVTLRGDRYVIPVKQEYKSFVNGIVHDQSATGATLFVEPMAIVQLNNALRETVLAEKAEIQRVLQAFTDRISPVAERIRLSEETISDIDVIFSKVKYALDNKCTFPELNCDGIIYAKMARHPLLDKTKVVPVTVKIGDDYDVIVVTGPNTGGKTVTLKTLGLMSLLAMSGMYVLCSEESKFSFFKQVYCDIGDEQSIEQNLSTFSGHITNLRDILNECGTGDLVLIDEVGAGTEPNEGAALALAVTDFLRKSGAKCVITTHYGKLKEYSLTTPRVENASMEFDIATLAPTYKLIMGVPGSSNALAIAEKLGLRGDVIDFAKNNVSYEKLAFEKVLQNADAIRKQYEAQLANVDEEKSRLAQELEKTKKLNGSLQSERDKYLQASKTEAKKIVEKAREKADEIISELRDILNADAVADKDLFAARAKAKELKDYIIADDSDDGEEVVFTGNGIDFNKLKVGDIVFSKKLDVKVKIAEIKSAKRILVKFGLISSEVSADDLYECVSEQRNVSRYQSRTSKPKTEINTRSFNNEINVIGQRVDEAVANIDAYIDQAILAGINQIWIIHGMGTGRLRAGIHAHLRVHRDVLEFRLGRYGEGENGVTVVTLK